MQQHHKSHLFHLLPVLFLLLTAAGAGVAAGGGRSSSVIRSMCAAVAKSEMSTYHYCVLTLSASPAAASARDARSLAIAAAELTSANITKTIGYLDELMDGLQGCVDAYHVMQGSVAGAIDDLRAGRLHPASFKLMVASWQPDYCDLDLMQMFNKDPISDENNANVELSSLANNIVDLIAPTPAPPPLPR